MWDVSRWYGQDERGAAIQLMAKASGGRLTAEPYVHSVLLEKNIIVNPPGAALYIGAARNVAIRQLQVYYRDDFQCAPENGCCYD